VTESPESGSFRAGKLPAMPPIAATDERAGSRSWRVSAAELRLAAGLLVALAIIGLLVGLIWGHVAPRATFTVVQTGAKGVAQQNDAESEAQIGVDGWFSLIGAGVGLVTGVGAWRFRSARGPFLIVALAATSLLGAVIAWRFGLWIGRHPTHSQLRTIFTHDGATFKPAIKMRAKAALFFQPIGAVLAALLSLGFSRHDDVGPAAHSTSEDA